MVVRIFFLLLIVAFHAGCGSPSNNTVDKDHLLISNMTENMLGPKIDTFNQQVLSLKAEISKACASESKVSDLKAKWKSAMMTFHYLETFAIGPLGDKDRSLAKHIYSWGKDSVIKPVYSQMSKAHTNSNYKFNDNRLKYKGLYALELILYDRYGQSKFIKAQDEACPYINLVADDLVIRAKEWKERWKIEVIEYFKNHKNRLNYSDFIGAIAVESQYIYEVVLHQKLSPLLGESNHLGITACAKNVSEHRCLEHKFSGLMLEAVQQNLLALNDFFLGKGRFGMVDYFRAIEENKQADQIIKILKITSDQWNALTKGESFSSKVSKYKSTSCSNDPLCQGYIKVVALAKWLKSEFLLIVNADLPDPVDGDND